MTVRRILLAVFLLLFTSNALFASAYDARPKLVVVIVIDQFRGDYLERYHREFGQGGFCLLMEHGAYFSDCYYDYATLVTGPGHATIGTGAYTIGHGIMANEWFDPELGKPVTSVSDPATKLVGVDSKGIGSSPHNLLSDTFGDELRMATQGKSRVFGVSLKDRAAILPAGYSANAAYWIDAKTGAWITSTYYMSALPAWVESLNKSDEAKKYLGREWKDASGKVIGNTNPKEGDTKASSYYEIVGSTPFANDLELDFARALVANEKLGTGPTTDLLVISLSQNDILGHRVGPDAPQLHASIVQLDRQLAGFFQYLDKQFGMANVWLALSADHGVAPVPRVVQPLHMPAATVDTHGVANLINEEIAKRVGKPGKYVLGLNLSMLALDSKAFGDMPEAEAEHIAGEATLKFGVRAYFTKADLAQGKVPPTNIGHKYLNSYSPYGPWWVMTLPKPFSIPDGDGTTHFSAYSYDTHVPLAFYGTPFEAGVYREHTEPIDLAVTLSSLLGTNKPAAATGRVLTEALKPEKTNANPVRSADSRHIIVK
jgi:predicted AlkP superfamily pyrophosphatase or phosphodiesterase